MMSKESLRGMRKDGLVQFEIDQMAYAKLGKTWREEKNTLFTLI